MAPNAEPSSPSPGYRASENRGPGLLAFLIAIMTVSIVVVGLRFWSRALSKPSNGRRTKFWWDDWLALASLVFTMVAGGLVIDMIRLGLGRHTWNVPPKNLLPTMQRLFAVYYTYNIGLTLAKASCLVFYTRLFGEPAIYKWFSKAITVSHTLNFGLLIGNIFKITFNYSPSAQMAPGKYRADTAMLWLSSAIPSVIIDLILLILPMPMIWKVRVGLARKVALVIIFICGYCVVVVSLGRLITIVDSEEMAKDLSYEGIPSIYWQSAEGPMTLLCICLPSLLNLGRSLRTTFSPPFSSVVSSTKGLLRMNSSDRSSTSSPSEYHDIEIQSKHFKEDGSARLQALNAHETLDASITAPEIAFTKPIETDSSLIRIKKDIVVSNNV